ncbi:MAG: SUMF1/EgtB/PvdO family nonheme iron enzyme [Verrucomicrobia bacterium]|nr:SUMF1/EgtB/PvdO family nonheme iron enzyme [Verrucomicrobiota bacterium]
MTTPANFSFSAFQRFSFFQKIRLPHALVAAVLAALLAQVSPALTIIDNFTDPANWGSPITDAGDLAVGNGRMNYTSASVTGGFAGVARNAPFLPTTQDWSLKVDAHLNAFTLTTEDQGSGVFLGLGKTGDWDNTHIALEFGRGLWGAYNGYFIEDDVRINGASAPKLISVPNLTSSDVALRMDYTAATHTLTYYFDADGASGGYTWVAQGSANIASGTYNLNLGAADTLSVVLVGLSDLQTVAAGQAYLSNLEITVTQGPTVTTAAATGITATTATLNGTVNPNGLATTAQFEYGLTTSYGSTAGVTLSPNNGTVAQNVSTSLSGLQVGQTYHYRLSAANGSGTTPGADLTFTTLVPPPLAPGELVAPRIGIAGGNVNLTVQPSVAGRSYQLQVSDTMAAGSWQDVGVVRVGDGNNLVISVPYVPAVRQRFYRLALVGVSSGPTVPAGFALIPAGPFQMGDQSDPRVGYSDELPVHTVQVNTFFMGKYEVTKEEWDTVRTWGLANGYTDLAAGNGGYASKGANHPVHSITWYDMVKWCNARSQKEGLTPCYTVSGATYKVGSSAPVCNWSANGYRLPTEAEWEKATRGGLSARNFPWGNIINHSFANYYNSSYSYESPQNQGYHPTYAVGGYPYSSPVGSFAPNGYGLYDMAGNMWEWCWDWYGSYSAASQTDPRGPASGSYRVVRGGGWGSDAHHCRVARRFGSSEPANSDWGFGFRAARSSVP